MAGLGSGDGGDWSFLDIITLISFCIGLQNLELNISQNDLDEQTKEIDKRVNDGINMALEDIHAHLLSQDAKLNEIMEVLHGNTGDI